MFTIRRACMSICKPMSEESTRAIAKGLHTASSRPAFTSSETTSPLPLPEVYHTDTPDMKV